MKLPPPATEFSAPPSAPAKARKRMVSRVKQLRCTRNRGAPPIGLPFRERSGEHLVGRASARLCRLSKCGAGTLARERPAEYETPASYGPQTYFGFSKAPKLNVRSCFVVRFRGQSLP